MGSFHTRRQIRVSKILVHKDFNDSVNDIALLRLGKNDPSDGLLHKQFTEEQVDLSVFSPACLPNVGESYIDRNGHVYGEQCSTLLKFHLISISGWGDTGGVQETSTDKLQQTEVSIVQGSNCIERMNQTEGVDEDLIVCAGGAGAGPCKVGRQTMSSDCYTF